MYITKATLKAMLDHVAEGHLLAIDHVHNMGFSTFAVRRADGSTDAGAWELLIDGEGRRCWTDTNGEPDLEPANRAQ